MSTSSEESKEFQEDLVTIPKEEYDRLKLNQITQSRIRGTEDCPLLSKRCNELKQKYDKEKNKSQSLQQKLDNIENKDANYAPESSIQLYDWQTHISSLETQLLLSKQTTQKYEHCIGVLKDENIKLRQILNQHKIHGNVSVHDFNQDDNDNTVFNDITNDSKHIIATSALTPGNHTQNININADESDNTPSKSTPNSIKENNNNKEQKEKVNETTDCLQQQQTDQHQQSTSKQTLIKINHLNQENDNLIQPYSRARNQYAVYRYLQKNRRNVDAGLLVSGYVRLTTSTMDLDFFNDHDFNCIICIAHFYTKIPTHKNTPLGLLGQMSDKTFPHIPNFPIHIQIKCLQSLKEAKSSVINMFVQYHKDKISAERKDIMKWNTNDLMLLWIHCAITYSCSFEPKTWEFGEYLLLHLKTKEKIYNIDDFYRQFRMYNRATHIWKRIVDKYHLKKGRGKYECCKQICQQWIAELNIQYYGMVKSLKKDYFIAPIIALKALKKNKWYTVNRKLVCGYFRQYFDLSIISCNITDTIANYCMNFVCDDNWIRDGNEAMRLDELAKSSFQFRFIHQKLETSDQLFFLLKSIQKVIQLADLYAIFTSFTTCKQIVIINMGLNTRINPNDNPLYLVGEISCKKWKKTCSPLGLWTPRIIKSILSINVADLPIHSPYTNKKYFTGGIQNIDYDICTLRKVKMKTRIKNDNVLKITYSELYEYINNSINIHELIKGVIVDCKRRQPGYVFIHQFLITYINNQKTKCIVITFDKNGKAKYCYCDRNKIITALKLYNPNLDITSNNFTWLEYCCDVEFHDNINEIEV